MSKVFQIRPKRIKRSNGTVLTPDMVVTEPLSSILPPHSTMEPKSSKKSTCASTPLTTKKHAATRMILNLRSWTNYLILCALLQISQKNLQKAIEERQLK